MRVDRRLSGQQIASQHFYPQSENIIVSNNSLVPINLNNPASHPGGVILKAAENKSRLIEVKPKKNNKPP